MLCDLSFSVFLLLRGEWRVHDVFHGHDTIAKLSLDTETTAMYFMVQGLLVTVLSCCIYSLNSMSVLHVSYLPFAVRKYSFHFVGLTVSLNTAPVIGGERLKKYICQKISTTVSEGPFCIVYIHTSVQREENSPGLSILRWIYEDLPSDYKQRLQLVYFLHPGLLSRLLLATLGRYFLSEGLYWKLKYISRLEFLWNDVKKGQIEIPEFVCEHDALLENRPLMDYGIETDPYPLHEMPGPGYTFSRSATRWPS